MELNDETPSHYFARKPGSHRIAAAARFGLPRARAERQSRVMSDVAAISGLYQEHLGNQPLIVNVPHAGTHILSAMQQQLTDAARAFPDTDWHVEKLLSFMPAFGVTTLAATHSRYVVDLNRDPTGRALYPGASNTELCPLTTFDDQPIYRGGIPLDTATVEQRCAECWAPYHAELQRLIALTNERHGYCIVLDLHSIRSSVPRFFDGRLPDLNLGTANGTSCAPAISRAATASLRGRFMRCSSKPLRRAIWMKPLPIPGANVVRSLSSKY
jgi:N-formylglutamate amidohydrolase